LLSIDVITIIFKHISRLNYDKYLIPHYECLCLMNTKNYHKFPIFRDGFTGLLDWHENKNIKYEMKFKPNCFVCSKGIKCKF